MSWRLLKCGAYLGLLLTGPAVAQTMFTEVTEAIRGRRFQVQGMAFGDYDNDGWLDLFLSVQPERNPAPYQAVFFHNEGNGTFAERKPAIRAEIPANAWQGNGTVFGDYDNDGDLDLFLPMGAYVQTQHFPDVLLRNDQGVFRDVTLAAGLTDSLVTDNAVWLDYDRDGYIDLYAGHIDCSPRPDLTAWNRLYRNQGDGTFADVTSAAGLAVRLGGGRACEGGSNGGMAAADFNDDGWPDLYMGVWNGPNRLFLNDGQGGFRDATTGEISDPGEAYEVGVGDIDNDGDLEIFQAAGGVLGKFRSLLLLNLGGGIFLDYTEGVGLSALVAAGTTFGAGLGDLDNDGDLDLLTTQPHFLYLNNGDGIFADGTGQSGIGDVGFPVSLGDVDRDGFLDVFFGEDSTFLTPSLFHFYRNNGNSNHYLRVELVGVQSNRSGIGVRLIASSGDLRQTREILGGIGHNQDELTAHFGLGARTEVDRLEVRWPSGQVEVLTDIPADQQIRIIEGQGTYYPVVPTRWVIAPPETLVVNTQVKVALGVQPALFEPQTTITQVTADLSAFGGPEAVPLEAGEDGTWGMDELPLSTPGRNGYRTLSVMIDQHTSLGPYWVRLSRDIAVLPAEDLVIFGDELDRQWQVQTVGEVELDFGERGVVFNGQAALALRTPSFWRVFYQPAEPVDRLGYQALRFAFHPGNATVPGNRSFKVDINGEEVILLGRGQTLATVGINMEVKDWQIVEIPLDSLKTHKPITPLIFQGNLEGTFYLDDLRLVAATPPPSTVVEEERTTALPQSFALSQNFPNPFNSDTVIRFALPESGEVELAVYNLAGQQVVVLAKGVGEAGNYTVRWDGRDEQGRELASGVYLYRLRAREKVETRKLVLVR